MQNSQEAGRSLKKVKYKEAQGMQDRWQEWQSTPAYEVQAEGTHSVGTLRTFSRKKGCQDYRQAGGGP